MSIDQTIPVWASLPIVMESASTDRADGHSLADWTRLLAAGDDGAWRWFHDRYYLTLLRYAANRSGDVSAASEIVQHAYLRIARHAKPFATEKDFSNWLFCLVRCAVHDHTRQKSRRSLLAEKYRHWRAAQADSDDGFQNSAHPAAALTAEAIEKLPAADSELLRQRYYEGRTTLELADELGTTSKAIEHRLARLRGRLREILLRLQ